MRRNRFCALLAATAFVVLPATQFASAATTYYWVGNTDGNLNLPSNWNTVSGGGGTTPTVINTDDNLYFSRTVAADQSSLMSADMTVKGIAALPTAGSLSGLVTIGGNYALTLTSTSSGVTALATAGNQSHDLTFNVGTLSLGASARYAKNPGTGAIVLNSQITGTRSLSLGNNSTNVNCKGIYTLTGDNSSFSGGFNLGYTGSNYNTTLRVNNANALGTGSLTIGAVSNSNYVAVLDNTSGGAITLATVTPIVANADFTFAGTNALNLGTGAVDIGNAAVSRTITVSTSTLTLGGKISGANSLVKAGSGKLVLGGSNTYSGGTSVTRGDLTLNAADAAGTGAVNVAITSGATSLTIGSDADGANFSNSLALTSIAANASRATLNNSTTAGATWSGDIAVTGDTAAVTIFSATSSGQTGDLTLSGNITGNFSNGSYLLIRGNSTANAGYIAGAVDLNGGKLHKTDGGIWHISGDSNSWGETEVASGTLNLACNGDAAKGIFNDDDAHTFTLTGGRLRASSEWSLGTGNTIVINSGRVETAQADAHLYINNLTLNSTGYVNGIGFRVGYDSNATVSTIGTSGATSIDAPIYLEKSDIATSLTLNVADNNTLGSDLNITADIADLSGAAGMTVVKRGVGTLTVSGTNTYRGDTIVEGNYVQAAAGSSLLDINNDGQDYSQILQYVGGLTGSVTLDGAIILDLVDVTDATGTWDILGAGSESVAANTSFGTGFSLSVAGGSDFTETADVWSYADTRGNWTFTEATGQLTLSVVPEPGTLAMLSAALLGLIAYAWRKRK